MDFLALCIGLVLGFLIGSGALFIYYKLNEKKRKSVMTIMFLMKLKI